MRTAASRKWRIRLSLPAASCPVITIVPPTLPDGALGVAYSQQLTASGGTGPYVFTVLSGTLPAGLTLSPGGLLSGTPTSAGHTTVTIQAADGHGCPAIITYTITVFTAVPTLPQTSCFSSLWGSSASAICGCGSGLEPSSQRRQGFGSDRDGSDTGTRMNILLNAGHQRPGQPAIRRKPGRIREDARRKVSARDGGARAAVDCGATASASAAGSPRRFLPDPYGRTAEGPALGLAGELEQCDRERSRLSAQAEQAQALQDPGQTKMVVVGRPDPVGERLGQADDLRITVSSPEPMASKP